MLNKREPILSVITVVYNNAAHIERTLCSVINQTHKHIQYIIIDGASNDGTVDIIKKYKEHLFYLISEPDKGIYDAMNKGLAVATGDYVLFMNSGDEIYALDTVEKVFACADNADIYYGETLCINERLEALGPRKHPIPQQFSWKSFKYGMNVGHQAIYVKRALAQPYDLQYRLSGDIDWILKIAKRAKYIVNTQMYVAKFLEGGASKQRQKESLKERYLILQRYYGFWPNIFNHLIITLKAILKK